MNFAKIIIYGVILFILCWILKSLFQKLRSIIREINNLCEFNYKAFYYKATYVSIEWYQEGDSILNVYIYACDRSYKSITNWWTYREISRFSSRINVFIYRRMIESWSLWK